MKLEVHPRKQNTTQQQPSAQTFFLRLFQTALAYFFVFFDANQSIPDPSLTGSLTLEVERKPFPTRKSLSKHRYDMIFYTKKQPQNTFGVAIFSKFWHFFFQFLLPRRGLLASTAHSQPRVVPRSSSLRGCHEEADLGNHR